MKRVELSICKQSLEYLTTFCAERNQGRSGKLLWDSFLTHAYKTNTNPRAVDLYRWLQEQLNAEAAADIDVLIEDYQRIGALFVDFEQAVVGPECTSKLVADEQQRLLDVLATQVSPGALPLGQFVPLHDSDQSEPKVCSLPPNIRRKNPHILVVGQRGTGKTDLMVRMLKHDIISNERAVIAVDPDGDLIQRVEKWAETQPDATTLLNRILIIDATSDKNTLKYNPLRISDEDEIQSAAAAVVLGFSGIERNRYPGQAAWNQQTANILRNCAKLLTATGKSLADLPVLVAETDYREVLLHKLDQEKSHNFEYKTLLEAWAQYKRLARSDHWVQWVEPILSRLSPALSDARIRRVLTSDEKSIDIKECILSKKIVLLKIHHALNDGALLLANLLIARVLQTASFLSSSTRESGRATALYVDGLHKIMDNEAIKTITDNTTTRSVGLVASTGNLVALNSTHAGLPNELAATDSWSRLLDAFGGIAVFRVDKDDAPLLAERLFPQTILRNDRLTRAQERANAEMLTTQGDRNFFWTFPGQSGATLPLRLSEESA